MDRKEKRPLYKYDAEASRLAQRFVRLCLPLRPDRDLYSEFLGIRV